MRTRTRTIRAGRGRRGGAVEALALGAAVALLGGCGGGDGDDPAPQTLPTDDAAGGGAGDAEDLDDGAESDLGGGTADGATPDVTPDELPGAGQEPGQGSGVDEAPGFGTGSGTVDPGDLDDREALVVEAPSDAPINAASEYLVFTRLFGLASSPDEFGQAYVELIRFDSPLPFADRVDYFDERWIGELDTCFVRDLDASDGDGGDAEDDPLQVSGGEALLIAGPAGTFGEIPRIDDPGNVFYDTGGSLPGPVPEGATLSIPGDDFPAVSDYPLVASSVPVRTSPAVGETLTTETGYEWVPGDGGSHLRLDFLADSDDGFLGFPVTCIARDDGAFELTDEAIDALVASPGTISVRYSRVAARIELRDGIVFFTANELAE